MSREEDRNYYNDPRTQGPAPDTFTVTLDDDEEVELQTKYAVCPVCQGAGTHVNPSIDCGGLVADDFNDDPDFYEDYMSGAYDVPCNRCRGKRVILVVDEELLTHEEKIAWLKQERDEADYRAECRMEAMYGA